jgi:hypothetical protein
MTSTEGQEQEQQQQQQPRPNTRFGPDLDGNEGMRVDVSERLRDAGAGLRGDSGDSEYPRVSNHYDGQEVIYKYSQNRIQNNCPQSIEDRADWIEKIGMMLADDGSGIRWMVINQQLPCIIDTPHISFETHKEYIQHRVFSFDRVIPFSHILTDTREKCTVSVQHSDGVQYKLQCPVRIWQALSKKVYTKLKLKIPHTLRRFHQTVDNNDGEALVKSIRTTCDNMSQTTAQLLELRKESIKFDNLSEWIQVRGDLLQLYRDPEPRFQWHARSVV